MKGLRKGALFVVALAGLAACAPVVGGFTNPLDGRAYRVMTSWPMLCHSDGSVILFQKANEDGGFTDASESARPCSPVTDPKSARDQSHEGLDAAAIPEAPDGFFGGEAGLGGMF